MEDTPFYDLTPEEITEMVEFCRVLFVEASWEEFTPTYTNEGPPVKPRAEWKWRVGDWRQYGGKWPDDEVGLYDQYIEHYIGVVTEPEIERVGHRCVPLPLAHQWEVMDVWNSNYFIKTKNGKTLIGDFILDDNGNIPLPHTLHKNPHYARYLAVKKSILKSD